MKLYEALTMVAGTTRGIRLDTSNSFESPEALDYGYDDIVSDDWTVEPVVVSKTITVDDLKAAWESARGGMVSVKRAEDSRLFNNIKVVLFG